MNRLYVGNLSYSTTDEGLREFFGEAGEVTEAEIVIDRATGRSKGFAFVTMGSDAAAQKAIEILNGQSLDNRALRIDFAKPKEDRPRSGGGGGGDRPRSGGGGGYSGGGGGGGYSGGGGGGGGYSGGGGGDRRGSGGGGSGDRRGGGGGGGGGDRRGGDRRGSSSGGGRREFSDEY